MSHHGPSYESTFPALPLCPPPPTILFGWLDVAVSGSLFWVPGSSTHTHTHMLLVVININTPDNCLLITPSRISTPRHPPLIAGSLPQLSLLSVQRTARADSGRDSEHGGSPQHLQNPPTITAHHHHNPLSPHPSAGSALGSCIADTPDTIYDVMVVWYAMMVCWKTLYRALSSRPECSERI